MSLTVLLPNNYCQPLEFFVVGEILVLMAQSHDPCDT